MMRGIVYMIALMCCTVSVQANKDRIAHPLYVLLIFQGGDTLECTDVKDPKMIAGVEAVLGHQRDLRKTIVTFATSEQAIFHYASGKLLSIDVIYHDREVSVSEEAIKKLPGIFFQSIYLIWTGTCPQAFDAGFFALGFDIDEPLSFGKRPNIEIQFEHAKYYKTTITRQVAINMTSEKDY